MKSEPDRLPGLRTRAHRRESGLDVELLDRRRLELQPLGLRERDGGPDQQDEDRRSMAAHAADSLS
jgi:hypothetical protein